MTKLLAAFHNFSDIILSHKEFTNTTLWKCGDNFDFDVLYILEPVKINDKNYSVHKPWFRYFRENFHHKKIIVMGFWDFIDSNYVFLFDENLHIENKTQKAVCNISPENFPLDAIDICDKLQLFFNGHGDSSVIDILNQAIMTSTDLKVNIINQDYFQIFLQELECLLNRWYKYEEFFIFLPFGYDVINIMSKIDKILQSIKAGNFKNPIGIDNITSTLTEAKNKLEVIDLKYLRGN